MKFLAITLFSAGVLATMENSYGGSGGNSYSGKQDNSYGSSGSSNSYGNSGSYGGGNMEGGGSNTMKGDASKTYTAQGMAMSAQANSQSSGMVHKVVVGGDAGLVYTPEFIMASIGDTVEFTFMKSNHSVTQSAFAKPCVKLATGVDSGLMPNPNNSVQPPPTFVFQVKTMDPTWFYCKQRTGTHCGKGMVFAINPSAEKTFSAFKMMAIQQNGTAEAGSNMGNNMGGGASATAVSSTVTINAGGAAATNSVQSSGGSGGAYVATGSGQGSGSTCTCHCLCGVAAWPAGAGIGSYGGYGGSLPMY